MHTILKYYIVIFIATILSLHGFAQSKKNVKTTSATIEWLSIEEVQERMKVEPRKVYIDVYTDWCGWCKVMDKKTFSHPDVIAYMNTHFYCVHFNAESAKPVLFNGKSYGRADGSKTNQLAIDWMGGRLSYPTSIFFDEGFINPQPVPGYLEVPNFELIATYFVGNFHRSKPFDQYQKEFKPTWKP